MKLLVFAQTPPPAHGQAKMVLSMLRALQSEPNMDVRHINCRMARSLEDMGKRPIAKFILLIRHLIQAYLATRGWKPDAIYFIPGPECLGTAIKDFGALCILRSICRRTILHWHAIGMESLANQSSFYPNKGLKRFYTSPNTRHICLSYRHAQRLSKELKVHTHVVPNGLPESDETYSSPCEAKPPIQKVTRCLFMSMCTQTKGFFRILDGVIWWNNEYLQGRQQKPIELHIAGSFISREEKRKWKSYLRDQNLNAAERLIGGKLIHHHGFVENAKKQKLLAESNVLCFPTDPIESFGLVLLEAMRAALPVVATDCNAIPEILGEDYPYLVSLDTPPRDLAQTCVDAAESSLGIFLESRFQSLYTESVFQKNITHMLRACSA